MFFRTGTLLVVVAVSLLAAGEDQKSVLLPGDFAQLSPKQFSEMFSKSMSSPDSMQQPLRLWPVRPVLEGRSGECAAPLTGYTVKNPDPSVSVQLPSDVEQTDRMATPLPIPVCSGVNK